MERFVAAQMEKGQRTAIFMTLETLALVIISYYIITFSLQQLLLNSLVSIFIILILNFILGQWTGFRLSEYFRFKELMEYLPKDSKKK